MKTKLLLIHGAWQGAWVWNNLQPLLEQQGIETHTMDLPGSGYDTTPPDQVTLKTYAESIISKLESLGDKGSVSVVAHSMGGTAATEAASLRPDLFKKLIYLCAFCPQTGQSVASLGKESHELGTDGPQTESGAEPKTVQLIPDSIKGTFFADYTGDLRTIETWVKQFRPQPTTPITTPVTLSDGYRTLEKAYIVCTQDKAINPNLQRRMAKQANIDSVHTLDSGHEPFFTMPMKLSTLLIEQI